MAKVYCFGNTENGELGLGGIEEEHILSPRKQRLPYDRRKYILIDLASGRNHTLLLLKNILHDQNVIFSCGSNERLQLGRVGSWKKLESVNSLTNHSIVKIACGLNHCLALSEAGQIFSWGCNLFGQLGFGNRDEQQIGKPSLVKKLATRCIVQIACGGNHCLALTRNGELYAWGSNAFGQLGIGSSGNCISTPSMVMTLNSTPIRQIAAGGSHSAILSYTSCIYMWGKNTFGQLGLNHLNNRDSPTIQRSLRNQKIQFISLGDEHSAALTNEGGLFTWGAGMYGQLGHGKKNNEIMPKRVFELMGNVITQVSCGRCHTLVASKRGRIYSFGLNGAGQLGIGSTQIKYLPSNVSGPWIEIDVKEILLRCDENSMRVLPVSPKITTSSNEFVLSETDNKKESASKQEDADSAMEIDELLDDTSNISENFENCLVEEPDDVRDMPPKVPGFVCVDNTVYQNKLQAVEIDEYESDPDSDNETPNSSERKQLVLRNIVASKGDQSFVITQPYNEGIKPSDFRKIDPSSEILKLDNSILEQFKDIPKDSIPLDIIDYIETTFSSIACLNASYIAEKNRSDLGNQIRKSIVRLGIDLEDFNKIDYELIDWPQAFHGFNMIDDAQNERIDELITQAILKVLSNMPDVQNKETGNSKMFVENLDEEVLRVFQVLPFFHKFKMTSFDADAQNLIAKYAKTIVNLSNCAFRHLNLWWCGMEKRYFKNLIQIFQKSVELNLYEQHRENANKEENKDSAQANQQQQQKVNYAVHQNLAICLEVLKLLYSTNKATETVSYKDFYIEGISEMFDLKVDYFLWKSHRSGQSGVQDHFLCDYPFIFDAPAKTLILATDSEIQQQSAAESSVYRQLLLSHPFQRQILVNPYLVISVHRNTILQETINQLCFFNKICETDFKKPLKVNFEGEEAIDAGQGMKKEFFLLLMKEILDEKYGMFTEYRETATIWFHHCNDDDDVMFKLIGILCGLAIYNKVIINLPFPLVLYKKILKEPLQLDDLSYLDPLLTKNLKEILDPSFSKEEFDAIFGEMNFVITLQTFGSPVDFDLCVDGKDRKLTYDNRQEYVQLYWKYILETSISKQYSAFEDGFMKVLDTDILNIFHAEELMQLVSGQEVIDWEELETATEYKPPFTKNHPTIRLFWKVFSNFTNEQKKKFLLFLTGSDRIPILGVKALKLVIQPMKVSEDHLPVVHTCFNVLDLPQDYKADDREAKLREKLLKACEYAHAGFALV